MVFMTLSTSDSLLESSKQTNRLFSFVEVSYLSSLEEEIFTQPNFELALQYVSKVKKPHQTDPS